MANVDYLKHMLVYLIQTKEAIHLSDESHTNIWNSLNMVYNRSEYWKEAFENSMNPHYQRQWNELRLWLTREAQSHPELAVYYKEVLDAMHVLDEGGSLREIKRTLQLAEETR